eukprot:gene13139-biopygen9958
MHMNIYRRGCAMTAAAAAVPPLCRRPRYCNCRAPALIAQQETLLAFRDVVPKLPHVPPMFPRVSPRRPSDVSRRLPDVLPTSSNVFLTFPICSTLPFAMHQRLAPCRSWDLRRTAIPAHPHVPPDVFQAFLRFRKLWSASRSCRSPTSSPTLRALAAAAAASLLRCSHLRRRHIPA